VSCRGITGQKYGDNSDLLFWCSSASGGNFGLAYSLLQHVISPSDLDEERDTETRFEIEDASIG